MLGSDAKTLHHAAAHHAPAQRAHHFPEFYAVGIDATASRLVSGKQFFARSKAADGSINFSETPGIDANPPEVFHRVPDLHELPIQHRPHAVGTDDEIAVAEIAVHQRHLIGRTRAALAQPAQ